MKYKIILLIPIFLLLNGCSMMIGKQEFSCKNSEELKDAGICGSSKYILENRKYIEHQSYKGFRKVKGTFVKCDDDCEEYDNKGIEQW
jgi:hypothetical protein